jgi:DNA-binding beta-propeller fold protein YncE
MVIDAPQGASNPACISAEAGPGDSDAFGWTVSAAGPLIKSIVLRHTGVATNVGLAFDNFSVSAPPGPLDVVAVSPADTVCTGESVTLAAFPTGGLAPYSFQWQQEVTPALWIDLGTGSTQSVLLLQTTRYRVIVTDAAAQQVTSAPVTVVGESGGLLCSASLLLSNFDGDNLIRYSFRSEQPEVFATAGSGGLNGPSKLICGPDGHVYVSSQENDRVLRYDGVTGAFIDIFVAAGSGGLNVPVGLDFGPDGNLYVVSNFTSSVLRYHGVTGAFIDVFVPTGSGLNGPTGMIFGPDNHLYVCSHNSDKVLRFDGTTGTPMGDFVTAGSGGLDSPRGLIFGPDGNLYIAEEINDSVRRYDGTTGAFIDVFVTAGSGGLDRANDIAFGLDDVLYVASYNNSKVLGYDGTTGAFLGALPDGILNGPAWLAVGCHPWTTGVGGGGVPRLALAVEPNAPNPFNPWTTVGFTLPDAGPVRVTVVDVAGRIVATLLERSLPAGRHVVEWTGDTAAGRTAPSGVYFIRVESGGATASRKMVLLR